MNRGCFITIEGIEGVGKSTNMRFVRDCLERAGHDVVVTRQPGGTPLAEDIRDIVLRTAMELPALTEMLLMFAARSVTVDTVIRPAVEAGRWVLCDRFTDATLAYQGHGRGVDAGAIRAVADVVHGDLWPDLTLLLDAPVETGLRRAADRSEPDRFEREELAFFERVRNGYLELARAEPDRIEVIDASQPLSRVESDLSAVLARFLERIELDSVAK